MKNSSQRRNIIDPQAWEALLPLCDHVLRPGARDGHTTHSQVRARSYLCVQAAKRLGLSVKSIETAVSRSEVPSFADPHLIIRIPASSIENAYYNEEAWERIAGWEVVRTRQISAVTGNSLLAIHTYLQRSGIFEPPVWNQVCGRWGLPSSYKEFLRILRKPHSPFLSKAHGKASFAASAPFNHRKRKLGKPMQDTPERLQASQRNEIRHRLISAFPNWNLERNTQQKVFLHIGPTNSGKTFDALTDLAAMGSGWYLAPLRLLAFEVYDALNARGVPCNLLTGEERIDIPNAKITAATIEMYDPRLFPECIVIDEAQMLADAQRGWAWTRALMETPSRNIHVLGAPSAKELVTRLATEVGMKITDLAHDRLAPLAVASKPFSLAHLPPRTILVAFSRFMVLALKTELEHTHHRSVSVIYGNLPPEVRRSQASRFMRGETDICVATDAVGMGLNLPADLVCFFETNKFDGTIRRHLTANEIQQIGGRAGRFGLSQSGLVGGLNMADVSYLKRAFQQSISPLEYARVSPTPEALALIPGHLSAKLALWQQLQTIPEQWREIIKPMELGEQIELAGLMTTEEIEQLGLAATLQLINAPTQKETRSYWRDCTYAILENEPMPLPSSMQRIDTSKDLERAESYIRSADIYLWLASRSEFFASGKDYELVHSMRREGWHLVDQALQKKIDTSRRCRICGRKMPLDYKYGICMSCFRSQRGFRYDSDF